jgi:hypothetical protein
MGPFTLPAIGTGTTVLGAIILIAFGLLNCFFGYRIFRFLLAVYGFILGAVVGFVVASNLAAGQTLWLVVGAVVGGLVGALLMVLLFFVGVFVVGGLAGLLLAGLINTAAGVTLPTVVVIIIAVIMGIVALILQRVVLILATAFSGAWAVVAGAEALITGQTLSFQLFTQSLSQQPTSSPLLLILVAWLALSVVGAVVQFLTTRERAVAQPERTVREPRDRW